MTADFFIWCSGADKAILKQCPVERVKFIGIGATIFLTAILASISGGYAIYFTFGSYIISFLLGPFWGVVIFSLDRYIVSSMKKTGHFRQEFLMATPRIAFALVLAITISKPIEVRLFNSTIERKLAQNEDTYNADCEKNFNQRRDTLDKKKEALEQELQKAKSVFDKDPVISQMGKVKDEKTEDVTKWQKQIENNLIVIRNNTTLVRRRNKSGQIIRRWESNSLAKAKKEENQQLSNDINNGRGELAEISDSSSSRRTALSDQIRKIESQYNEQISGVQRQINDLNADRPSITAKCKTDAGLQKDLLDRLEAIGSLKKMGNTVWYSSIFITLLFILLETAPGNSKNVIEEGRV